MNTQSLQWSIGALAALAVAAVICFHDPRDGTIHPVSECAEKAAAVALLAEKLTGPGYFNAPVSTPPEDGELWIAATDARAQVPRIAAVRKLPPEAARKVGQLITKLSEHHPYRVVGGERVNLLRLNLSLDAIK